MKKAQIWICGWLVALACCAGCGSTERELSEESQELVAEYAAGLLLKYNAGSSDRLLEGKALELAAAEEDRIRQREEQRLLAIEEYQNKGQEEDQKGTSEAPAGTGEGGTGQAAVNVVDDMADFLMMNSFSVVCSGYETMYSYPDPAREDAFMSIDAPAGKQLVVVKFTVTNVGLETATFDMLGGGGEFQLKLGETMVPSDYTLLLDDMSTYRGDLEAGQSEQLVLLFEVEEALAAAPGAVELVIGQGDSEAIMIL